MGSSQHFFRRNFYETPKWAFSAYFVYLSAIRWIFFLFNQKFKSQSRGQWFLRLHENDPIALAERLHRMNELVPRLFVFRLILLRQLRAPNIYHNISRGGNKQDIKQFTRTQEVVIAIFYRCTKTSHPATHASSGDVHAYHQRSGVVSSWIHITAHAGFDQRGLRPQNAGWRGWVEIFVRKFQFHFNMVRWP